MTVTPDRDIADVVVQGLSTLKKRVAAGDVLRPGYTYTGTVDSVSDDEVTVLLDEGGVLPARNLVGWMRIGTRVQIAHEDGVNYVTARIGGGDWFTDWVPTFTANGALVGLSSATGLWTREGQTLDVQAAVTFAGPPPTGDLTSDLPLGMQTVGLGFACGAGWCRSLLTGGFGRHSSMGFTVFTPADGNGVKFWTAPLTTDSGNTVFDQDSPWPWDAGDTLSFFARVVVAAGS